MRIVLLEPEIPQNTGNIARLASALGVELLLVGRLGFSMSDKYIKRSGMDYWDKVNYRHIPTLAEYYGMIDQNVVFISTKGDKLYTQVGEVGDVVFGNESSGLPPILYEKYSEKLYRIPMKEGIRSINLAASAAIVGYHIAAKEGFKGLSI